MFIFYLLIEIVLYLSELVCQIMVLMKVKLFKTLSELYFQTIKEIFTKKRKRRRGGLILLMNCDTNYKLFPSDIFFCT